MLRLAESIKNNKWTFAKTMAYAPHEYTVREWWESDAEFVFFVEAIRKYGYKKKFGNMEYIYFDINGHSYWTMGEEINKPDGSPHTIIINRAKKDYIISEVYDNPEKYDTLFTDEDYIEENKKVIQMANIHGDVLDVGFGTGLLLDHKDINPEKYVGIDPSRYMVDYCKKKYPGFNFIHTNVADFAPDRKFGTIVGLFGVGSYLDYPEMLKLYEMLETGGTLFLMFYANDYSPVLYEKMGVRFSRSKINKIKNEDGTICDGKYLYILKTKV